MEWTVLLAHFFAGAFLINSTPHLVNGVSGREFQTPFASPPGVGKSPAALNVVWGLANLVVGYLLLTAVGHFTPGLSLDSLALGLGLGLMGWRLAASLGRINSKAGAG